MNQLSCSKDSSTLLVYKAIILTAGLFFGLCNFVSASEASSENRGLEIAVEADRRDQGFVDSIANLTITLINQRGEQASRDMRQMSLEGLDDGDKSIMVFDTPPDLKGTAILTFTHKTKADDQWLYLPALKRVKRISSSNKSGPFVGSEFAYEDIAPQAVEKYLYDYAGDEQCGEDVCFVIMRIPVDRKSGYSRQQAFIDQHEYRMRKIVYYDRKGDLLKTMTFDGYRQYLGKFWRPDETHMTNHQTGKSTTLSFGDYQFQQGLKDSDFTRSGLSRIR